MIYTKEFIHIIAAIISLEPSNPTRGLQKERNHVDTGLVAAPSAGTSALLADTKDTACSCQPSLSTTANTKVGAATLVS